VVGTALSLHDHGYYLFQHSGDLLFVISDSGLKLFCMKRFLLSWFAALLALGPAHAQPERIPADPEKGFAFPYILTIPENVGGHDPLVLVVETNNTGPQNDFQETVSATLDEAGGRGLGPMLSRHMGLPFLMPVFPRTRIDGNVYTHALDRDTLLIRDEKRERLDLQLLAMVEDARLRLRERGLSPAERFLMVGFSASGSFSNRFAFLHPEHLIAVVSGGINAFPMLPVSEVAGDAFPFPLGTADLAEISCSPFNHESWKVLPQLIFMGADDANDAIKFDDAYSARERALIFKHLGEPMHQRWLNAQSFYLRKSPRVTFITYGNLGHWITRQVGLDIVNFIAHVLDDLPEGKPHPSGS